MGIAVLIIVLVVVAAAAVAGVMEYNKRRLRAAFGPEYDRLARESGSRWEAYRELLRRRRAFDGLSLRPLSAADRERFASSWRRVQSGFIDDPRAALERAERLVGELLDTRGYPAGDESERLALLSVGHAGSLAGYRGAKETSRRAASDGGSVTTEDVRQAVMGYRGLFQDLMGSDGPAPVEPAERPAGPADAADAAETAETPALTTAYPGPASGAKAEP